MALMQRLIPPLCLLLALAMAVAAFALWAVEAPEAGIELHRARVSGDEPYRQVLEAQLKRRRWARKALLGGLFVGSGLMIVAAFLTMRPAEGRRKRD